MPSSKAQQAATAKRRAQAIALRLAGMDHETIAERLGYASRGAASKDIWRAVEENRLEEAQAVDNLREVEGARLDRLQAAAWPKAVKGDLKAIETILKVIAQRSRLFGLDAPVRAEVSGPDGGAIPLGAGTLAELNTLIGIAGNTGPVSETSTETGGEEDGDRGDD